MSLTLALNNALSGLNINQQSLAALSQNIANANTPGYSRKIISQQALYLDGQGAGVRIEDISRKVDDYLVKATRLQGAVVGKASASSDYFDRTQLLLGNPGSQNSLTNYLSTFFNTLQSLAQTPENTTLRVNTVNTASSLARQVRTLAEGLQDLRLQSEQDITTAIATINRDITDIKGLNTAITSNSLLGKSVADLEDRRDTLLRDLSQYIDVSTYLKSSGEINIFTGGGISLLDDSAYELVYSPQASVSSFINDGPLGAISAYRLNDSGERVGRPNVLVTEGTSSQVVSSVVSGKLRALLDMRDRQLPGILNQLDILASNLRDQFNDAHNAGTGFPGALSYTGTRAFTSSDFSQWTGSVRFAVLDSNGRPIASPYDDEVSGLRPLTLDLSTLDTGLGAGFPSLQGIVNEFNQRFGVPSNKVEIGNLNNIRLASASSRLPGSPPSLSFDFDVENISGVPADFYVTSTQILDDNAVDITSLTSDVPQITLEATGTYEMTAGSTTVTVNTTSAPTFAPGDKVYLSTPPGTTIGGIPAVQLGGFVTVTSISDTGFQFTTASVADTTGPFDAASQTVIPKYATIAAGQYGRTTDAGRITSSLASNTTSSYYTVKVNVATDDGAGGIKQSTLTYRVDNSQSNLLNRRYSVDDATNDGVIVHPNTNVAPARAILVDEEGVELSKTNGVYTTTQRGYLKIIAGDSSNVIAIDSMDSAEGGQPNAVPQIAGSGKGFSSYFALNNFFKVLGDGNGDQLTGSAINFSVEDRILNNTNLISLGTLTQTSAPADPLQAPFYTYERNVGDNTIIQQLGALASSVYSFAAAGGLGQSSTTFGGYTGSVIGSISSKSVSAKADSQNAKTLLDGYTERADSVSGVNLDEELANTVIYQNAYTASTRVISVVNDLFDKLMQTF